MLFIIYLVWGVFFFLAATTSRLLRAQATLTKCELGSVPARWREHDEVRIPFEEVFHIMPAIGDLFDMFDFKGDHSDHDGEVRDGR